MLHPPGPTAKRMMTSRIPARTPPRINVTIPAITRITAMIQSSEAVPPFNRATGDRYESTTAMPPPPTARTGERLARLFPSTSGPNPWPRREPLRSERRLALGQVHCAVGFPDQLLDRLRVLPVEPGRARAHGQAVRPADLPVPLPQLSVEPLDRPLRIVALEHEHAELVPPEPGGEVRGSEGSSEHLRHVDQRPVALGMAERVVDGLRPVHVDEHHGGRQVSALGHLQLLLAVREEGPPVAEPGELVDQRQAHVLHHPGHELGLPGLVPNQRDRDPNRDRRPILSKETLLEP